MLVGALVMGVLSALPIIAVGNVCCCLWVISGGVVAAYVLQQGQPQPITPADGAFVGFLAGLLGAFVYLVISVPIDVVARTDGTRNDAPRRSRTWAAPRAFATTSNRAEVVRRTDSVLRSAS